MRQTATQLHSSCDDKKWQTSENKVVCEQVSLQIFLRWENTHLFTKFVDAPCMRAAEHRFGGAWFNATVHISNIEITCDLFRFALAWRLRWFATFNENKQRWMGRQWQINATLAKKPPCINESFIFSARDRQTRRRCNLMNAHSHPLCLSTLCNGWLSFFLSFFQKQLLLHSGGDRKYEEKAPSVEL